MNNPSPLSPWHPASLFATWFGSGLLPYMPGTWGSLVALPLAWIIAGWWSPWVLFIASGSAFVVGIWAAGVYAAHDVSDDPSTVVIDEVAGQWLVLSVVPLELFSYLLCFLLFRAFDIVKPWPIRTIEHRIRGGFGIMLDDLFAAAYAILFYCVIMVAFHG